MAKEFTNLPDFDSLPEVKGMPQGCAWGVFDQQGRKDNLGCLNLLTPAVVKEAYKEAREGVSVSLNWPIGAINKPGFMRVSPHHVAVQLGSFPVPYPHKLLRPRATGSTLFEPLHSHTP